MRLEGLLRPAGGKKQIPENIHFIDEPDYDEIEDVDDIGQYSVNTSRWFEIVFKNF